jgi:hypothetical protein
MQSMGCGRECRDPCHKAAKQASALQIQALQIQALQAQATSKRAGLFHEPAQRRSLRAQRRSLVVVNDRPKSAEKERQERRLRAALRENLKRRKAQAKGRATGEAQARASHDSAGIAEDKKES